MREKKKKKRSQSGDRYVGMTKIQGDSKLLSGFSWPIIFKSEKRKSKLLTEYESVTQRVLLYIELMLQNAKEL
jgi:hypothetical protein